MHETGTAKNLLRAIEKELAKHSYSRLLKVRIGVGVLTGIEPDHLLEHMRELAPGSVIEGAVLEAVEIEPQFVCRDCGQVAEEKAIHTRCPDCGSDTLDIRGGKDLTVLSVDVE